MVTVDETDGDQDDDTQNPAVSALFVGVLNTATDADLPQYATSATPLVDVSGSSEGADEEGATTVISLEIVGGDNTDSGLATTGSLLNILLVKEGDLIVGRVDSNGDGDVTDGDAGDVAVFAIAIDQDGDASIALYHSLDHLIAPNDFDDTLDLDGLVNAVVTVTDGDGDVDTQSIGIGDQLKFDDDGPNLNGVDDSTNSLVFAIGTMDSDLYNFDVGADDEGAPGVVLTDFTDPDDGGDLAASGLDDLEALLGVDITAVQSGNTVTYFTPDGDDPGTELDPLFELTVDDSGWTFEIFQDAPLVTFDLDISALEPGSPVEDETFLGVTGVWYSPRPDVEPILKEIEFNLEAGEAVAIMGASAAGKSTLCKVLVGSWQPSKGYVRLDATDLHRWEPDKLGPYIGYLPQDVELFATTVWENISRLSFNPNTAAVVAAAKAAGVHEMILSLPQGYDTPIGPGGVFLSGGQRQRIGLARTMYSPFGRHPRLIVLDEPSSNLDAPGDQALMAAIKTMKEWGTTVVMVTHNMRLLGPVDKIMVLNEGRIQAIGDRAEVLAAMRPKSVRISNPEPMRLPKDDSEPGSATITELGA